MEMITEISENMQEIFLKQADKLAKETGFVERESKLSGKLFAQTLVFGWWSNPNSTLEELSNTAMKLGLDVSSQAIEQRFNIKSANFLKELLDLTTTKLISTDKCCVKLLNKFSIINIMDSSIIALPNELENIWRGCGSSHGTNSAMRIQVKLDLLNGKMCGPFLENGRGTDKSSLINKQIPQKGGLTIADLGYHSVDRFKEIDDKKAFFISRWHVQTNLYDIDNNKIDLIKLLKNKKVLDIDCFLSAKKLPVRLVAVKVPDSKVEKRKAKIKDDARKKQKSVTFLREQLVDYNIFITNADESLLSIKEVIVLMKMRWQIELLFKLWKSEGKIAQWRTKKVFRILTEIYAKLIVMVMQHWIILIACWQYPDRSLTKAVRIIRKDLSHLIFSFKDILQLQKALKQISNSLKKGVKTNKRKKNPAAYQLLNKPQSLSYALA